LPAKNDKLVNQNNPIAWFAGKPRSNEFRWFAMFAAINELLLGPFMTSISPGRYSQLLAPARDGECILRLASNPPRP
jgi:hypothetical protein